MTTPSWYLMVLLLLVPATSLAQLRDVEGIPAIPFYSVAGRGDTLLAGATNVLYISTDRGSTWHASSPIVAGATSVDAVIATDAGWFVGCFTHGVFRSVDQGATWAPLNQGLSGIGALYVSDFEQWDNHLYAATEGAGVFELDLENPTLWHRFGNEFAQNVSETVAELALQEGHLVAAAGGNGFVFVRDLQEDYWTPVQLGGQHLSVAHTGLGLITTTRREAYVSLDHGATWQPTGSFGAGLYATIASAGTDVPASTAYLAVSFDTSIGGLLYRSSDLTQAWEQIASIPETSEMMTYNNQLYLAQPDGLRIWLLDPDTGNEPALPTRPELQVASIAPHPARDQALLRYETDQAGWVRLEVFDVLGRRVATLDDYASAGQHMMVLETATLPAGLYLARLRKEAQVSSRSFVVVH